MRLFIFITFLFICIGIAQRDVQYVDQMQHELYIPSQKEIEQDTVTSSVSGEVKKGSKGIPGLDVYIVHPKHGRSNPRPTSQSGGFEFTEIPVYSADSTDLFYLEIYWGKQMYYQNTFVLKPGSNFFTIQL